MKAGKVTYNLRCSDKHFTAGELICLQEHGHELQSIASSHVPPGSKEEEVFLEKVKEIIDKKLTNNQLVVNRVNYKFQVFLKYVSILSEQDNLFEINHRKLKLIKKNILESRATRGGRFTDDQENRFH